VRRSRKDSILAFQPSIWPLRIIRLEPAPWGTADAGGFGHGEDGNGYVLKRIGTRPDLPASEFLCYVMAHAIGLPLPGFTLAQVLDTPEICFASRWEAGVADELKSFQFWLGADKPEFWEENAAGLGRWFAFDHFVRNTDRHPKNFLLRIEGVNTAVLGIDFSRALIAEGWPKNRGPFAHDSNTMKLARAVCTAHEKPYPSAEAVSTLSRLAAIPDEWIDRQLEQLAEPLLPDKLRRQIMRWWRAGRQRRLQALRRHIANGRYLPLLAHPRSA